MRVRAPPSVLRGALRAALSCVESLLQQGQNLGDRRDAWRTPVATKRQERWQAATEPRWTRRVMNTLNTKLQVSMGAGGIHTGRMHRSRAYIQVRCRN